MKFSLYAVALLFLSALAVPVISVMTHSASADDPVPCEDMLSTLRDAAKGVKPSDAEAAKLKELEDKGIERCNADDDQRADDFFTQALKLLGK